MLTNVNIKANKSKQKQTEKQIYKYNKYSTKKMLTNVDKKLIKIYKKSRRKNNQKIHHF